MRVSGHRAEDATLVEVNPLVLTVNGRVIALDGNAAFRHDNHAELADAAGHLDPVEKRTREHGLKYVTLDGSVGIIGNGAGLVMSTLDVVSGAGEKHGGQKPANFLDIGGGGSPETMTAALEIVRSDDEARSVRQRLRRHHLLRRRRHRHCRGPDQARRRVPTATASTRAAPSARTSTTRWSPSSRTWTRPRTR